MLHRCIIHVIDTDASSKSASGWLEDTSKVQKYVMSDEDYAKRENTYKQFKMMKQKVSFNADTCRIGLMSGFLCGMVLTVVLTPYQL